MKQGLTWVNTSESFGRIARFFHWFMALWIIVMLGVGLYMVDLPPGPLKFQFFYSLHKMAGFFFFIFLAMRLLWRFTNKTPELPPLNPLLRFLAKSSVPFLYGLMLMMPISGFIMSEAAGFPIEVWGIGNLPLVLEKNPQLAHAAQLIHHWVAWILIGVVVMHVLASLLHHFVLKDNVLRRMWRQ